MKLVLLLSLLLSCAPNTVLAQDPIPGDPIPGDPIPGDPIPGDPILDPIPDDPIPDDPIPGDPIPYDPIPGDPIPDDPIPGDPLQPPPQDPSICSGPHASFYGDPHVTTFDGLHYDCQGAGEFVLAKSNGLDPLLITGRFVKSTAAGRTVSVGRAVGIKVEETVPPIQISTQESGASGECTLEFTQGIAQDVTIDDVSSFETNYPSKLRVYADNRAKNAVLIFPGYDARVNVSVRTSPRFGCLLSVDLCLTPEYHGDIVGLFGSPNGGFQDDWMTPSIPVDSARDMYVEGYKFCMDNWCINNSADSLFSSANFDVFNFCDDRDFDVDSIMALIGLLPQSVVDSCALVDNPQECLLDVSVAVERGANPIQSIEKFREGERQRTELAGLEEADLDRDGDREGWCKTRPETGVHGDPHFKTWKNEHFEYHGQCDLVLLKDPDFANGVGITIQIRTKLVRYWSYIKQVAIQIGDDILEVQGSSDLGGSHNYWLNFEFQSALESLGGFPITLNPSGDRYTIDLDSLFPEQKIVLKHHKEFVGVDFIKGTSASFGKTVGILGDFNTGKTVARDGATILNDFNELGTEWQVLPSDGKLFREISFPQFPAQCIEPENPRGDRARRLAESTISEEAAEAACSHLKDEMDQKDCVYDIVATQDLDMVGAY
ncbi:MAG: hypothetical protein SGBAC_007205 [Bacillariaceae sp.]